MIKRIIGTTLTLSAILLMLLVGPVDFHNLGKTLTQTNVYGYGEGGGSYTDPSSYITPTNTVTTLPALETTPALKTTAPVTAPVTVANENPTNTPATSTSSTNPTPGLGGFITANAPLLSGTVAAVLLIGGVWYFVFRRRP